MTEYTFYSYLVVVWIALSLAIFVALFFISAPYGRYSRRGWGPVISNRNGWLFMESVSAIGFALCFIFGRHTAGLPAIIFLLLWEFHYVHRAFVYPFTLRGSARQMPLSVVTMALVFNAINAYINGRYLFTFSGGYTYEWLTDPRFIAGTALFIAGFIINKQSDTILRALRSAGNTGYAVANTGLYRWISCPNYLGEIITWIGWAIATWSLPGLAFALWTIANLAPRARSHHTWYRQQFPDYPQERKALIPYVW